MVIAPATRPAAMMAETVLEAFNMTRPLSNPIGLAGPFAD
jgi:hypothetical protein